MLLRVFLDFVRRNPNVVHPFFRHFDARAFAHRLLDVIARTIGIERIEPNEDAVFGLIFELPLAVNRPGASPTIPGILHGHNAARANLPGTRVALGNFSNIRNKGFVHVDGGAHPVRFLNIGAESIRTAEAMIFDLSRHRLPKVEGIASSRLKKA